MTSGSREAIPPGIDISRPHSARMYDYFLGGKDNFAIDRATAEAALQRLPALRTGVRENRRFLARAVRYLAGPAGRRLMLAAQALPCPLQG
jgi:S-adenosyl methyltransferase